jgi:DeoR/GlpR family transcriptional regulator of sugar metabolism
MKPSYAKRIKDRQAARDERLARVLAYAIEQGYFSVEEAANALKLSPITVGRHLKELADAGKLKRRVVRTHVRHVEFEVVE